MFSGKRIWAPLLDLVLPRACPVCNQTLSRADDTWCGVCTRKLMEAVTPPSGYCHRCARTIGPYLQYADGCADCRDKRLSLDGMARVGPYRDILKSMIASYKFGRDQRLDRSLGTLLASAVAGHAWAGQLDALIPVPTTWWNRLRYRFRPAVQLARVAGRELRLPALPLIRVAGKKHNQMDLPASERPRNVRGVFKIHPTARVAGTQLCVVDDVCTSGATLNEIARVLKKAGAVAVYGAVVAKTDVDDPMA